MRNKLFLTITSVVLILFGVAVVHTGKSFQNVDTSNAAIVAPAVQIKQVDPTPVEPAGQAPEAPVAAAPATDTRPAPAEEPAPAPDPAPVAGLSHVQRSTGPGTAAVSVWCTADCAN